MVQDELRDLGTLAALVLYRNLWHPRSPSPHGARGELGGLQNEIRRKRLKIAKMSFCTKLIRALLLCVPGCSVGISLMNDAHVHLPGSVNWSRPTRSEQWDWAWLYASPAASHAIVRMRTLQMLSERNTFLTQLTQLPQLHCDAEHW